MYKCPKCQSSFEKGTKFCQNCGYNLEVEFLIDPVCPTCQKTFPDGTKFCNVDGTKLTTKDQLIPKCRICGKAYSAEIKFCPDDGGQVMAQAAQPSRVSYPLQIPQTNSQQRVSSGKRFGNFIIDVILAYILLFLTGVVMFSLYPQVAQNLQYDSFSWMVTMGVMFLYYFVFETTLQKTPAKFLTGTKVVMEDGSQPDAGTIAKRTLIRFMPLEPLSGLVRKEYRGIWLHDRWTKTLVVNS